MSTLLFDGIQHKLSLIGNDGETVGEWIAYNNVDRHATISHLANHTYPIQDRSAPRRHVARANGPYGLHGIIRFHVLGHPGIGVHSGRADAKYAPGPAHATMGCIRTSDQAMSAIIDHMRTSPLSTISVVNNGAPQAQGATRRHGHRHLNRAHHA
ncbi:MAG: hypothetical protein ABIT83_14990 [Massilia sp.]